MTSTTTPSPAPPLTRQYVKLCDVLDFEDERLRATLRSIVPGKTSDEERHRKYWEYAMLAMYLEDVRALRPDADVLAVAAGHEEPLFWLANRVRRVVATDIYGAGDFASGEADSLMLANPAVYAPYAYRADHLEVMSMDARRLSFPDSSFDVVYSLSSIEHFGQPPEIRQAAAEMARVLRPGGHLVIVTECLVARHPLDEPLVQVALRTVSRGRVCGAATLQKRVTDAFRPVELERDVIGPTKLPLVQPLDTRLTPETRRNVIRWRDDGELRLANGQAYPHVLLKAHGAPWTSVFLAMHRAS